MNASWFHHFSVTTLSKVFDFLWLYVVVAFCEWWKPHGSANREYAAEYLPPEIWEKIFQRLPLKSLGKCICVCKDWKSIITDKAFILDHLSYRRANNNGSDSVFLQYQFLTLHFTPFSFLYWRSPSKHIIKSEQYLSVSSDDDKKAGCLAIITTPLCKAMIDLDVVGTCNGLVCFIKHSESSRPNPVIIMNPSIRKYRVLPAPYAPELSDCLSRAPTMFGFGFDSRNKDFKVVMLDIIRISSSRPCLPAMVQVYSLARHAWRRISHGVPSIGYCSHGTDVPKVFCVNGVSHGVSSIGYCSHGTGGPKVFCVNGAIHWMFCGRCNKQSRSYISTFDLAEETFGEITLPNCWDEKSCFDGTLLVRGSCLALTYVEYSASRGIKHHIWVMEEYGVVDSWNPLLPGDPRRYPLICRFLGLGSSEEMVVETNNGDKRTVLIEYLKRKLKALGVQKSAIDFAADHVESLFLINQPKNNAYDNGVLDLRFVSPI